MGGILIKEYYPDLKGKNVCVSSCGDSTAVFSFCALGANVTATDISYTQIENARKISEKMYLNVTYHVCDSLLNLSSVTTTNTSTSERSVSVPLAIDPHKIRSF